MGLDTRWPLHYTRNKYPNTKIKTPRPQEQDPKRPSSRPSLSVTHNNHTQAMEDQEMLRYPQPLLPKHWLLSQSPVIEVHNCGCCEQLSDCCPTFPNRENQCAISLSCQDYKWTRLSALFALKNIIMKHGFIPSQTTSERVVPPLSKFCDLYRLRYKPAIT